MLFRSRAVEGSGGGGGRVPSRARHVWRAPQGPAVHGAPVSARHAAPAGRLQQRGGRGRRQHAQPGPADCPQLRRQGGTRGAAGWETGWAPEGDEGSRARLGTGPRPPCRPFPGGRRALTPEPWEEASPLCRPRGVAAAQGKRSESRAGRAWLVSSASDSWWGGVPAR